MTSSPWAARRRQTEKRRLGHVIRSTREICFQNMCVKVSLLDISMEGAGASIYCTSIGPVGEETELSPWAGTEQFGQKHCVDFLKVTGFLSLGKFEDFGAFWRLLSQPQCKHGNELRSVLISRLSGIKTKEKPIRTS